MAIKASKKSIAVRIGAKKVILQELEILEACLEPVPAGMLGRDHGLQKDVSAVDTLCHACF